MQVTKTDLKEFCPQAQDWIVDGIVENQSYLNEAAINTPLRLCHFMAQIAIESDYLKTTLEYGSGEKYEGRIALGNTHKGDGIRYKGRGLIQDTGRANYRAATSSIRKLVSDSPDFEQHPELLQSFPWALLSAIVYWQANGLNAIADADDIEAVTRGVNGGLNGLEARTFYLKKAKSIWLYDKGLSEKLAANIMFLQQMLQGVGLYKGKVDGIFGPLTYRAVSKFQQE